MDCEDMWIYDIDRELFAIASATELTENLKILSDKEFINEILSGSKSSLNDLIENHKFPAWDIAKKLKDNDWIPTKKQRIALTNVYVHAITGKHVLSY